MIRVRSLGLIVALTPWSAAADIAYDNISGNPGRVTFLVPEEMADDTTLDSSAGLTLDRVEVGIRMLGAAPYNGTATLKVYEAGANQPGALLAALSIPLALSDNSQHFIEFDFANFVLPGRDVWTSIQFTMQGGQTRVGFLDSNEPTIGSTTDRRARRNPDGTWNVYEVPDAAFLYRIHTVPGAPTAALGLIGLLATARRRDGGLGQG